MKDQELLSLHPLRHFLTCWLTAEFCVLVVPEFFSSGRGPIYPWPGIRFFLFTQFLALALAVEMEAIGMLGRMKKRFYAVLEAVGLCVCLLLVPWMRNAWIQICLVGLGMVVIFAPVIACCPVWWRAAMALKNGKDAKD